ncbi:UNVERIFIED_ORG: nucleoside phosphorylase [Providencia alcalifaciens]
MRIIIVDDNIEKTKRIIREIIGKFSIDRECIMTVSSANQARRVLESQQYELMILDLNLPLYIDDEDQSIQVTIDLITDMNDDPELNKPHHIIGLSEYEDMVQQAKEIFDDNLWALFKYDSESDDWINGVTNCLKYLISAHNRNEASSQIDICFITALAQPELSEVLNLPLNWSSPEPLDNTTFITRGTLETARKKYSVIAVSASRMGMVSSSVLTAKIIGLLKPKFLVMAGICAGIKGKVGLGDPILVTTSWDYQSGKRISSNEKPDFLVSPHQIHVEEHIESRFRQMAQDSSLLFDIKKSWKGDAITQELTLHTGSMASGSAVLADESFVKDIIRQERTLLGVEMEVYGFYYASRNSSNFRPITFAVKSVCDFADEQKNDGYQKYAAYTSAKIIHKFFLDNIDDIDKM